MKNKRGETFVAENLVFIILNIVFLAILVFFIVRQGNGAIQTEEQYAKQIALMIDSARPEMELTLNMDSAKKISDKNGILFDKIVSLEGNMVRVRLSDKGGYEYSFFNNVNVESYYPDGNNNYVFIIK